MKMGSTRQENVSDPKSTSEDKTKESPESQDKKESKYTFHKDIKGVGFKAGPTQPTESKSKNRNNRGKVSKLPDTKPYDKAPYINRDDFKIQSGDFIRYVKEDNIIYQGTILRGTPVEHDFQYYHGQDDDFVVKLNFDNGKHVAEQRIQLEDRINVLMAKEKTSFGRNVETVSPSEIIAVSPEHEYDWYKFGDVWDTQNDVYDVDTE